MLTRGSREAGAALVREAEAAVQLAAGRPDRAVAAAREVQRRAGDDDLESASVAERALGLAAKELGDLTGARAHLEAAVELARRGRLDLREGQARGSLAVVLALGGATTRALEEADAGAAVLHGAEAARLEMQRALILQRLGRHDAAMRSHDRAAEQFIELGHWMDAAQVHTNRGILHAYRGDLVPAEADLRRAHDLYVELGLDMAVAEARHNLGFVAARRGDLPTALACYDAAAEEFRRLGVARPAALLDRCEALLAVRLVREARPLAQVAVDQLERDGMQFDLAEARLVLAQAMLLQGDHLQALATAEGARRSFLDQGRSGWAALAAYAALSARWHLDASDDGLPERSLATARQLEEAGWAVPAADARLIAARTALARGRLDEAEGFLLATSAARRSGPAELRARAWHAEALLQLARGDQPGALDALGDGLAVLDQHQAALGATELRVHSKSLAGDLATLGLRIALDGGRPEAVLSWAERWRAGAHRIRRARPPDDPALAASLAELRQAVTELQEAAGVGRATASLLRRQAALEGRVRRQSRHLPGPPTPSLSEPASVEALAGRLGQRALVEMVELDGGFHAVTLVDGRARLRPLACASEVAEEVAHLRFSLGRLVASRARGSSAEAGAAALRHACERLDQLLFRPLLPDVEDRAVVMVPTGALHQLPWALLASCRDRPITVCPSATRWLLASHGDAGSEPARRCLLVAGPHCGDATPEVADLSALVGGARVLAGEAATVASVLAELARADLAHLVAHGTFRSDNPLFSSLRLADGPLTVYDMELLPRVPRLLVLSACDGGRSAVAAGDELIGLASALLAFGAGTVVASVTSVPDDLTRLLMLAFHQRVASGMRPAAALAAARSSVRADVGGGDPRLHAITGFTCFGAG